jgi:hypothetical protein
MKKNLTKKTKNPCKHASASKPLDLAFDDSVDMEDMMPSDGGVITDRRLEDRRGKSPDRRKIGAPVAVERRKLERRAKVSRRRQIDPTTCERDYLPEEVEFMNALDQYKRTSGRMFPTCSEILEVIRKLGYEKRPAGEALCPATAVVEPAGAVQTPAAAPLPA